ncbi:sirohydrochlorin chelatase [Luedemannella helvata]|uniref:Sirohydrochlorin chelatase n=1 Tax=Luedemannella helvata TaxID=349315 RepID=A0ABP4X9V4_9ACTN
MTPLVITAHGSPDLRSPATMRRLAGAVGQRWPGPVVTAFLEFNLPAVPGVLRGLASPAPIVPGPREAREYEPASSARRPARLLDAPTYAREPAPVLVPALLTRAYHGRVDIPAVLRAAGVPALVASVLGPAGPGEEPDPLLLAALRRRLSELYTTFDGLALIAAGTRVEAARDTVRATARALGASLGVPCEVGFASATPPSGADAVRALRRRGATRIVASSYFLAAGKLHDIAATSAREAGAVAVAAPLADAPELADLIVKRAKAATPPA